LTRPGGSSTIDDDTRPSEVNRSLMAEETIITWNAANWVTVLIMVALGFTILAAVAKIVQMKRGASGGS